MADVVAGDARKRRLVAGCGDGLVVAVTKKAKPLQNRFSNEVRVGIAEGMLSFCLAPERVQLMVTKGAGFRSPFLYC